MSDIFNHMFDAYSQDDECGGYGMVQANPLFYHRRIYFDKVLHETFKATLFAFKNHQIWIPNALCKKLDLNDKTVYVHNSFKMLPQIYKITKGK